MTRIPFKLALAGALAGIPACGDTGKHPPAGQTVPVGDPAPAFQAKTIDGEYIQLSDYAGKVVMLNVWATWCKPCKQELPELVALHHRYADQGFMVLGVSVDVPSAHGQVRHMVGKYGLDYPIALDPNGRALAGYGIRGYPTTFLIDREGNIRWRRDGMIRPDEGEVAAQIKAAL